MISPSVLLWIVFAVMVISFAVTIMWIIHLTMDISIFHKTGKEFNVHVSGVAFWPTLCFASYQILQMMLH